MAAQFDINQSDDQFMAVTDTVIAMSDVVEEGGSEALLVINLGPEKTDAIIGGEVTGAAINRAQGMLDELRNRVGLTDKAYIGVMHCWK